MLKDFFLNEVKSAIKKAVDAGKLGQMGVNDEFALIIMLRNLFRWSSYQLK